MSEVPKYCLPDQVFKLNKRWTVYFYVIRNIAAYKHKGDDGPPTIPYGKFLSFLLESYCFLKESAGYGLFTFEP